MNIRSLNSFVPLCLTALAVAFCASPAFASVTSTFDTGLDGWTHAPGGDPDTTVTYSATGGNPGGAALLTDAAEGNNDFFLAPAKYLGNDSADLGGTFSFQLMDNASIDDTTSPLVTITDAAGDTLSEAPPAFAPGSYVSFSFKLNQSGGFTYTPVGGSGSTATLANFQTVLANVSSLVIRGDFHNGTENTYLDNVALVPEPGTFAVVGLGIVAGLGVLRRDRRRA